MARRRNRTRNKRRTGRQTGGTEYSITTTPAILDTIALKSLDLQRTSQLAGGTLTRFIWDISVIVGAGTANASALLWGIVADSDSVIGDLPNPFTGGNLDVFARYHFVTQLTALGTDVTLTNVGDPQWNIDVKSGAMMEDNQRLFICGEITNAGTMVVAGLHKYWWKEPAA